MDINYENMNDFHQTVSRRFFGALAAAPASEYSRLATTIQSTSERNTYPFLGEIDSMRKWIGPRVIRQLKSHRYAIENEKFELTMSAKVDHIKDDQGGAVAMYGSIAEIYGRSVARQPDELMFQEVIPGGASIACYDGQNFFDTDHPVGDGVVSNDMGGAGTAWYLLDTSKPLMPFIFQPREEPVFAAMTDFSNPHVFMLDEFVWGAKRRNAGGYGLWQCAVRSKQTLDATNLQAAWERMTSFTNDEGVKLGCRPDTLLVSSTLEWTANELVDLKLIDVGGVAVENRMYKKIKPFVSQWLVDA